MHWFKPVAAMLKLAPAKIAAAPSANDAPATGELRGRLILLQGCVEPVLSPEVRSAAVRVLSRAGYHVLFAPPETCCGALVHHLGQHEGALAAARRNLDAWSGIAEQGRVDAIVTTASGCGAAVKDYGYLLRDDPAYAEQARKFAAMAKDISEVLDGTLPLPVQRENISVALHSACSLNHGQRVRAEPERLLRAAGFSVRVPAEAHLCCGSAGVYNILQPDIGAELGRRKAAALDDLRAEIVATTNIGCAVQIGNMAMTPVVHTVELLDWATGGPVPRALTKISEKQGGSNHAE